MSSRLGFRIWPNNPTGAEKPSSSSHIAIQHDLHRSEACWSLSFKRHGNRQVIFIPFSFVLASFSVILFKVFAVLLFSITKLFPPFCNRLLKALGAPTNSRIYWAGGEPLGGKKAVEPLIKHFPNLYNKHSLALPGELQSLNNRASLLAAIDYIVALNSDVFMASHGGNMGRAIQVLSPILHV